MSYILDIIILAIIAIFVFFSAKKGFVKTAVSAIGLVAAVIIAFSVSAPAAEYTYDKLIEPSMVKAAAEKAEDKADSLVSDGIPANVLKKAKLFGINTDSVSKAFSENAASGTESAVTKVSQTVIRPVAVKVMGLIIELLLFIVLMFVVKILAKLLGKIFSFSVIGKANRFLGGVIGFIEGSAVAVIFCLVISLLLSYNKNGFWIFTPENIDASYLFRLFSNII